MVNNQGFNWFRRQKCREKWRPLAVERLEPRLPRYGEAITSVDMGDDIVFDALAAETPAAETPAAETSTTAPPRLTISFAPDGTDIQGHASNLFAELGQIAPISEWQAIIVSAFETWSQVIGAQVCVVEDSGDELGAEGESHNDPRFGDIRIAALPMLSDIYALGISRFAPVGTFAGDVLFNSDATLLDRDELFKVALHEAGHVLGLDHSDDPNSPMYDHGIPSASIPTEEDFAALRRVFQTLGEDDSVIGVPHDYLADEDHEDHEDHEDEPEAPVGEDDSGNSENPLGTRPRKKGFHFDHDWVAFFKQLYDRAFAAEADASTSSEPVDSSEPVGSSEPLIAAALTMETDVVVDTIYVTDPQLVVFDLSTSTSAGQDNSIVSATITAADGEVVEQFEAQSGSTAQSSPVLLLPGEYEVELDLDFDLDSDGATKSANTSTNVMLSTDSFSFALGPTIADPTSDPLLPEWYSYFPDSIIVISDPLIFPYRIWFAGKL